MQAIAHDYIALSKREVKALLRFMPSGKKGPRLQRLMVDFSHGLVVATDGHRLILMMAPEWHTSNNYIRFVDRATLEAAIKTYVGIHLIGLYDSCGVRGVNASGETFHFATVRTDDNFPNWRQVADRAMFVRSGTESLHFSGDLLADSLLAMSELCHTGRMSRHNRTDGIQIRMPDRFEPMRLDGITSDNTRVIALVMPFAGDNGWADRNTEAYTERFGGPKQSAAPSPTIVRAPGRFDAIEFAAPEPTSVRAPSIGTRFAALFD